MVCATPRVEPGFWLGDNISEAHLHQPGPTGALRWVGPMGHQKASVPAYSFPESSCGKSELYGEESGEMGVQRGPRPGSTRPLTALLRPFRSGVFNMRASNTSSVSLRTYNSTEKQRGGF